MTTQNEGIPHNHSVIEYNGRKKHCERVARKIYNCFKCGKLIPKGSLYYRSGHRFVVRIGCSMECHDTQDGHWK